MTATEDNKSIIIPPFFDGIIESLLKKYSYADISREDILNIIQNSSKLSEMIIMPEDEKLVLKFKNTLDNQIKKYLKNKIEEHNIDILVKYLSVEFESSTDINIIKYNFQCVSDVFRDLKLELDMYDILTLITSVPKLNSALETLYNYSNSDSNKKLKIDDEILELFLETYKAQNGEEYAIDEDLEDRSELDDEGLEEKTKNSSNESDDFLQTDPIKIILIDAYKYPLLSKEETEKLILKYRSGSKYAGDKLIKHNQRLVLSVAKRYLGRGCEYIDLFQEGCVGLVKAIEKFDIDKGLRLSTYATWWIRQAVTRYIADNGKNIRIPVHLHEQIAKFQGAINVLNNTLRRNPKPFEIAEYMGISEKKVLDLYKVIGDTVSINVTIGDDEDTELQSFIPDITNVEDSVITTSVQEKFHEIIKTTRITEREFFVLMNRYGLKNADKSTLDSIGRKLNVTRERIRQIEVTALEKLIKAQRAKEFCELCENPEQAYQRLLQFREILATSDSRRNPLILIEEADTIKREEEMKVKVKDLCIYFGVTKEVLKIEIEKLTEKEQAFIRANFDNDYIRKENTPWDMDNSQFFSCGIARKIKKNLSSENTSKRGLSLVDYLKAKLIDKVLIEDVTIESLRIKVSLLEESDQEILKKLYDENFEKVNSEISTTERGRFYQTIVKRLMNMYSPKVDGRKNRKKKTVPSSEVKVIETQNNVVSEKPKVLNETKTFIASRVDFQLDMEMPFELQDSLIDKAQHFYQSGFLSEFDHTGISIILLKLGHNLTNAQVASVLKVTEERVKLVVRKYLLMCKSDFNKVLDQTINGIVEDKIVLNRKKDEEAN